MEVSRADNLTKVSGAVRAVDGVSLSIAAGEVVALLGPNLTVFAWLYGVARPRHRVAHLIELLEPAAESGRFNA